MMSIDERLDKAEEMIQKPSFRENKGLGNEVGYYIFDTPLQLHPIPPEVHQYKI